MIGGEAKAYPENLGWWHEIINDRIGDTFISVTLCPLTGTGLVFDAEGDAGEQIEFGVSGLLLNSNLVMFDRRDQNTLIPQMIYTAISGEFQRQLRLLPVVETTWATWKKMYPETKVAQFGTGLERYDSRKRSTYAHIERFSVYPYGNYRTNQRSLLFFTSTNELDLSYDPEAEANEISQIKDIVLGICSNEQTKAYPFDTMPPQAVINDLLGDTPLVVVFDAQSRMAIPYSSTVEGQTLSFYQVEEGEWMGELDLPEFRDVETGTVWNMLGKAMSGPLEGAQLRQLPAYNSMWFGWAAFYPETQIWTGEGLIEAPSVTAVEEVLMEVAPGSFALGQNYPNPFNPQTHIQFAVANQSTVSFRVFNSAGQLVSTLVDGHRSRGLYLVNWDGRDDGGTEVASGNYVYRLELPAEGLVETRTMTLVR